MISVEEAKAIIYKAVKLRATKKLRLDAALGLTLAEDVIAGTDIPNFTQSSMDGYAVRFAERHTPLEIIGEMAAGAVIQLEIGHWQATRIFTGAPLPEGADTVVMQEKVSRKDSALIIEDENLTLGLHVRPKGSEVQRGQVAMPSGTFLSAAALGFLAGIGCTHVSVYAPPSVAIILTGNELQEPGKPLQFGQVYEANSIQLTAALHETGITKITIYRAQDDAEELTATLAKALQENDIVLLNGGVSVGDYDYVADAAKACAIDQKFHKIKQKPGKPLLFGTKGEKLVFGLPGNPSSSLTCFYEYVLPALEKIMQLPLSVKAVRATVTHDYIKPVGLTHFLKASYYDGRVTPLHAQESYRLHSFAQANCLIVLPEDSAGCKAGDLVDIHLLPCRLWQ